MLFERLEVVTGAMAEAWVLVIAAAGAVPLRGVGRGGSGWLEAGKRDCAGGGGERE